MASSKGSGRKQPAKKIAAQVPAPAPSEPRPKWVVVQLTSMGEKEKSIDVITRSVHRILGNIDVFVPAISQKVRNESHTTFYMDGYIFVRHREDVNYLKLQDTTYFRSVLCSPGAGGKRAYCLLEDNILDGMRDGIKNLKTNGDFARGQEVKIVQGNLKGLRGRVNLVYDDNKKVQVHVPLQSKPVLIEFPPNYLEKVDA